MALSKNEKMETEIFQLRQEFKKYRTAYSPGHLYVGLFGRSGCGKTSLINSLMFAVWGPSRNGQRYPVGNVEKAGGHTLVRVVAPLESNISVIDNRGVDDLTKEGTLAELEAQLDGKRGFTLQVQWEKNRDDLINAEKGKYAIGCAVFVFSARDNFSQSTHGLSKAVHCVHLNQGRYPVAVITNVDLVDRRTVEILISALKVTGISEFFQVANITTVKEYLEISYQYNLLSLLDRCMSNGNANAVLRHHRQVEQDRLQAIRDEEERRLQAIRDQNAWEARQKKKDALVATGLVGSSAGAGALIGAVAGPVGAGIGAVTGAAVGGVLSILKKIVD